MEFNRVLQDELYSFLYSTPSFFLHQSIYPPISSVFFLFLYLSVDRFLPSLHDNLSLSVFVLLHLISRDRVPDRRGRTFFSSGRSTKFIVSYQCDCQASVLCNNILPMNFPIKIPLEIISSSISAKLSAEYEELWIQSIGYKIFTVVQ